MSYEFADRLVELRKKSGMSQEDLAQRIGLSRQAVSKWERAESSPDIGNLVALSEVYGVTMDELVRGVDESVEPDMQQATPKASGPDAPEATACESASSEAEAEGVEHGAIESDAPASPESRPPDDGSAKNAAAGDANASAGAVGEAASAPPEPKAQAAAVTFPPPPNPSQRVDWAATQDARPQAPRQAAPDFQAVPDGMPKCGKTPLQTFPYPVFCAILYLVVGFVFGWWHPAWIIFLTIPFYYWIVNIIVKDANYQARHGGACE